MIFAHAPAGLLAAWLTQRFWFKKKFKRKQVIVLYGLTILGGLFPDIDLFYYYLVDASASHREFFTHSALFYLAVFVLLYFWAWYRKSFYGRAAISLFILGSVSHLFLDSLGVVALFYPLTSHLYGWSQMAWFSRSILGRNLFATNYILEIIISCQAGAVFTRMILRRKWLKWLSLILFNLIMAVGFLLISEVSQHVFKGQNSVHYGDQDGDGIVNKSDLDMDGDGLNNWADPDANGNSVLNSEELRYWAGQSTKTWYDQSEGGRLEIPLRMGLVTETDFIKKIFEQSGIYFRKEMTGLSDLPVAASRPEFDRNPGNWKAWLESQGRLSSAAKGNYQAGRIVFYGSPLKHAALIMEVTKEGIIVADATPERNVQIRPEAEVAAEFGPAQYIGRVFKD